MTLRHPAMEMARILAESQSSTMLAINTEKSARGLEIFERLQCLRLSNILLHHAPPSYSLNWPLLVGICC